ncbi:GNAT family N-acetyltransferase [Sphingomonas sp. Leaf10]|uniref:GNAT family N-acetyltransferase n=1 Tax=Sphingomonas sp. Leaf10 TaxID=1735676 RepID=UPI0009E65F62|nr:GNAT family N-acetyltransferase [Sphingomonas sp. Leaf10]
MPVRLRPVRSEDLPVFFAHQCDPVAAAMAGFTPRDRVNFDAHWHRILADTDCIVATIEADDAPLGYVSTFLQDRRREIAFWIDRAAWNRGIARAAVSAFLAQHPERPVFATVLATNAGSRAVLHASGFRAIGPVEPDELLLRLD